MIAYLLIFVALASLLIYVLASKPEVKEIGRLAYFAAVIWICWTLVGQFVTIFKPWATRRPKPRSRAPLE